MAKKGNSSKVDGGRAHRALTIAKNNRQTAWTHYIVLGFRETGNLAPGCDMRDLQAFYEEQLGPRAPR